MFPDIYHITLTYFHKGGDQTHTVEIGTVLRARQVFGEIMEVYKKEATDLLNIYSSGCHDDKPEIDFEEIETITEDLDIRNNLDVILEKITQSYFCKISIRQISLDIDSDIIMKRICLF